MNADDAINKPKFHHQWLPDMVAVEGDFSATTRKQLEATGYSLKNRTPWSRTEIILVKDKKITAVGDKRADDAAEGY